MLSSNNAVGSSNAKILQVEQNRSNNAKRIITDASAWKKVNKRRRGKTKQTNSKF